MQEKGVKVIAITSLFPLEKFGVIKNMADFRCKELKNHGIDFSSTFPERSGVRLWDFVDFIPDIFPFFQEGVLFTARIEKGMVLERFLSFIKCRPRKVLFIDDQKANLESIEENLRVWLSQTEFHGFYYTMPKPTEPVDLEVINYQADCLIEHKMYADYKLVESVVAKEKRLRSLEKCLGLINLGS